MRLSSTSRRYWIGVFSLVAGFFAALISFVGMFAGAASAVDSKSSFATAFIPPDIIAAIDGLPAAQRQKFCYAQRSDLISAQHITPVERIAGFTSRMKDDNDRQDPVPGAKDSERFARLFGALSAKALVSDDEDSKRSLVRLLAKWAEAGAFLKTKSCVRANRELINTGECGEWRKPDGSDPSAMKDATFATFIAAGLIRAYEIALADTDIAELADQHAAIRQWIGLIEQRLKQPTKVYFGLNMGWYWPSITADLAAHRTAQAGSKLKVLEKGLVRLINDDGSITDRTSRGDRALWYHHTSIDEIVISMELMRAAGMPMSPVLERKLHAAVALFIAAIADEHVLDKWAVERHHARYAGKQDWDWAGWQDSDFAGSWFHIYAYRYPERAEGKAIRKLVPNYSLSANRDIDFGMGIGCIYNAAADLPR